MEKITTIWHTAVRETGVSDPNKRPPLETPRTSRHYDAEGFNTNDVVLQNLDYNIYAYIYIYIRRKIVIFHSNWKKI